jgi:hypothetical protein
MKGVSYLPGDDRHTEVVVHRAGAIGDQHVPKLTIVAVDEMPEHATLGSARLDYIHEGQTIADALLDHLSGGVIDQLLARLLERKASLLRVTACVPDTIPRRESAQPCGCDEGANWRCSDYPNCAAGKAATQ